jgi:pimeloyl-ACP methyl ester carboxylesterase
VLPRVRPRAAVQRLVLCELLAHWGLDGPAIAAHDIGGAITLRAHLLEGRDFSKLTLLDAVAPWGSPFFALVRDHVAVFQQLPSATPRRTPRALRRSRFLRERECEQFLLDRHDPRTRVEAPSRLVALLDDDVERSRAFRDRVTLCVGEQPVSDAPPLVAWRDEELVDDHHLTLVAVQGDIPRGLIVLAGDEDHIALQHLEYPLVAPAGQEGKRLVREPEQLRQIGLDPRGDLDLGRHRHLPRRGLAGTNVHGLEPPRQSYRSTDEGLHVSSRQGV